MTESERVAEVEDVEADAVREGRKSDFAAASKSAENKDSPSFRLGQCYPQHCPQPQAGSTKASKKPETDPLGEPMSIGQVAELFGCSVWTVRQRYLPSGLPYFRIGSAGKLLFYRKQIVQWILEKQTKGRR
jgi:hypothetical protein